MEIKEKDNLDHLAGTGRARRRVLEEASRGTRAVRLCRKPFTLCLVHARFDLFRIVRRETQCRTEQQLAFAKRGVAVVPLNTAAGNFNHLSFTRYDDAAIELPVLKLAGYQRMNGFALFIQRSSGPNT